MRGVEHTERSMTLAYDVECEVVVPREAVEPDPAVAATPAALTLAALEASLLNTSGNVPLHNRFRALFTLKALKNDDAVKIISKGERASLVPL